MRDPGRARQGLQPFQEVEHGLAKQVREEPVVPGRLVEAGVDGEQGDPAPFVKALGAEVLLQRAAADPRDGVARAQAPGENGGDDAGEPAPGVGRQLGDSGRGVDGSLEVGAAVDGDVQDGAGRRVDLMGDAGGKLAEHPHLLGLDQFALGLADLPVGFDDLGGPLGDLPLQLAAVFEDLLALAVQLAGHPVEPFGEGVEFVAPGADVDRRREVAGGDPLGAPDKIAERGHQPPREHQEHVQAQGQHGGRHEERGGKGGGDLLLDGPRRPHRHDGGGPRRGGRRAGRMTLGGVGGRPGDRENERVRVRRHAGAAAFAYRRFAGRLDPLRYLDGGLGPGPAGDEVPVGCVEGGVDEVVVLGRPEKLGAVFKFLAVAHHERVP